MSVSVPQISVYKRKEYWKNLLIAVEEHDDISIEQVEKKAELKAQEIMNIETPESEEELHKVIRDQTDPLVERKLRAYASIHTASSEIIEETEHMLEKYSDLVEPNPRSMKRLVNAFGIQQAVNFLVARDVENDPLVRWTIIELRWPLLADLLSQNPQLLSQIGNDQSDNKEIPEELKRLFINTDVNKVVKDHLKDEHIRQIMGYG